MTKKGRNSQKNYKRAAIYGIYCTALTRQTHLDLALKITTNEIFGEKVQLSGCDIGFFLTFKLLFVDVKY